MHKINFLLFLVLLPLCMVSCQVADKLSAQKTDNKKVIKRVNPPDTSATIEYLMGKFDPKKHPEFIEIPIKYADRAEQYIRKEVFDAFVKMYYAAAREGILLQIRSATRNFNDQKRIWENKWSGKTLLENKMNAAKDVKDDLARAKKILEYSSMPGTSRHHWGTDMDFNSFDNQWFGKGEGLKLYTWMKTHAASFGFCQPYTALGSDRKTGYFEEKWHWTYMPLSTQYTAMAKKMIKNEMIDGFSGSETAMKVDMVKNYILGISPACNKK